MSTDFFVVEPSEVAIRLDLLLRKRYPAVSRTSLQKWIEGGFVLVNGEHPLKRSILEEGDSVELQFPPQEPSHLIPEPIPLDILFEDDTLIVINKPAGLVVHPGAGNLRGTLVHGLLHHYNQLPHQTTLRPGIVHRLDKETSGVLVVAKNEEAHWNLVEQFASRAVEKEYLAITWGHPKNQLIQAPIGRDPHQRQKMGVVQGGKPSETTIELISTQGPLSLIRALPKTGRTHQIRVHLSHIKTPVIGDLLYGSEIANKTFPTTRHLLHAKRLTLFHPKLKKKLSFEASPPEIFSLSSFFLEQNKKVL